MMPEAPSERGFSKLSVALALTCAAVLVVAAFFAGPLRRAIRESLMQRVTSAHYQVLCPPGAMPPATMTQFASQREPVFTTLARKLNDVGSHAEVKVIFDPKFTATDAAGAAQLYEVTGTTIRTRLVGAVPQLSPAADAEALLHAAWGKPGSPLIAHWTALWLVGQWHGEELGMAAAEVEQRLGHKKVANLLDQVSDAATSHQDRALLGAAWVNAIAELGGPAEVQKLYSTQMTTVDVSGVANALGTTPAELERKWQMWIYAYIAGMPPAPHAMTMPMDMPMSK